MAFAYAGVQNLSLYYASTLEAALRVLDWLSLHRRAQAQHDARHPAFRQYSVAAGLACGMRRDEHVLHGPQRRGRSDDSEGLSVMVISGLSRGFSTCCLRFMSGVAVIHARLASGWLARLYREGVEPSGSR